MPVHAEFSSNNDLSKEPLDSEMGDLFVTDRIDQNLSQAAPYLRGKFFAILYTVSLEENISVLLEWRCEIDAHVDALKNEILNGGQPQNSIALQALAHKPSERDIVLYSIASFIRHHKSKWHKIYGYLMAAFKIISGGRFLFEGFGKKTDICIDHAFIANYLAASYGIYGRVEAGYGKTRGHHIWKASGESGSIIDVSFCPHLNGFVQNPDLHDVEMSLGKAWKQGLDLRTMIEA